MGEKLKIAMLGQKRVPSHEGGIEIVVEELSTRMAAKGHDVTLYNRGGHHVSGKEFDSQKLTEYKSVKLKSVPTIDRKGLAAVSSSFFGALRAAFGKYDVVHFHAEGPCAFMWIPKLFGKAICDSLLKKKSNLDIVWLVRDTSMKAPFGIRYVKLNSIKGVYELVTAKIWMDNRRKLSYVRKRKEQFYIQEWHGGGPCLKYIEKDATALPAEYVAYARNDSKMADLMISGSKWRTNNIKSSFWYDGEIIECDLMKNEDNRSDCEICDEVFNFFDELGANDNILLYAPTFRADHDLSCYHMDFEAVRRALIDKYGGEWKIIVRLHPNIANLDGFMTYSESIINGSKYPGINDLIVASKFLVTDYSGCMFEGFRLKTKVVLYALDLEHYTSNERGLYFDIRNLPSPLCENMEQFISCIRNFDEDKYEEQRQNFVDEIGYCKEPGPEIIADRVLEVIEER